MTTAKRFLTTGVVQAQTIPSGYTTILTPNGTINAIQVSNRSPFPIILRLNGQTTDCLTVNEFTEVIFHLSALLGGKVAGPIEWRSNTPTTGSTEPVAMNVFIG